MFCQKSLHSSRSLVAAGTAASRFLLLASLMIFVALWGLAVPGFSQIATVDNSTLRPVDGAGHDYIKLLSETVNPANGSVSLRIDIPTAKGRGLTLPFSINYDSGGVHHLMADPGNYGHAKWSSNIGTLMQGGWSYSAPGAGYLNYDRSEGTYPNYYDCTISTNYVFRDTSGAFHSLGVGTSRSSYTGTTSDCQEYPVASGGDQVVSALLTGGGGSTPPSGLTLAVYSGEGTVYQFNNVVPSNGTSENLSLPTSIEDRNGNRIVSTASGFTDTLGRNVLNWSGFGPIGATNTITASGLNYQVTWKSVGVQASFTVPSAWVGSSQGPNNSNFTCYAIPAVNDTQTVVSMITLPDGEVYNFYYGNDATPHGAATNQYGLLSEIDYPQGGWVTYSWKLSDTMNEVSDYPGVSSSTCNGSFCSVPAPDECRYQYKTPVVASRTVSFDGTSPALTQTFVYNTSWASGGLSWTPKTTDITSVDNTNGKNLLTHYSYTAVTLPTQPYSGYGAPPSLAPVESQIVYYDFGDTTHPLKTVNKTWNGIYELMSEQTVYPTGQSTKTVYGYGSFAQMTSKDEYDFGATTNPTRMTRISYQQFSGSLGYIADKPCSVVVCSTGSVSSCSTIASTRVAETDYLYDGGTAVCGASGSAATTNVTGLVTGTHDDTLFDYTSSKPRGNLTKQIKWLSTGGSATTTYAYDKTGQVMSVTDPCGNPSCSDMTGSNHTTTYTYTDSWASGTGTPSGQTNAYVTTITYPNTGAAHIEHYTWGFTDGLVRSHTDQNSALTTYNFDSVDRLSSVVLPADIHGVKGETDYYYPDAMSVEETHKIDSTRSTDKWTLYDGVGHISRVATFNDQTTNVWDQADTCYDGFGRAAFASYPYQGPGFSSTKACSSNIEPGDATVYDGIGRAKTVTHSDGSSVTTTFSGPAWEVTDEGNGSLNEQKIFQNDAFGRLTSVCEVSSGTLIGNGGTPGACGQTIAATGFLTAYAYDTLGNLISVSQGNESRNFTYDSLSRLLCSSNPEIGPNLCQTPDMGNYTAGTVRYAYDANGNVSTRTKPQANQTGSATTVISYNYDTLNRVLSTTYSDSTGSNATYTYDQLTAWGITTANAIGRLSSESNAANTRSVFNYDPLGRTLDDYQCAPSTCGTSFYDLHYDYDLASDVISATNGQGVTFTSAYNRDLRLSAMNSSLSDTNHPGSLLSNVTYGPAGRVFAAFGNGFTEERFYSARGQLQNKWVGTLSNGSLTNLVYTFGLDLAPDGNITRGNDSVNGNWAYSYDQFNRLYASAEVDGTTYGYAYDRYGNRWQQNGPLQMSLTFSSNNNHVDGYSYDAAGNVTCTVAAAQAACNSQGGHTLTYDAAGHVISVDSGNTASYVYDSEGRRVRVTLPGESSWNNIECLFDLLGHCITKTNYGNQGWSMGEVYAGADHVATYNSGTTFFTYSDWLGTERYRTYPNGAYAESCSSLPFGDNLGCPDDGAISPLHLTGKERDDESGLDYFGARYYASSMGRFMSPDPAGIMKQKLIDPQQWNMYSYVRNNPLHLIDPTGKWIELLGNDEERKKQLGALQQAAGKAGSYLYDNYDKKSGRHFVGIYTNGEDGKGPSFQSINAVANKLGGIINDTQRGAVVTFVEPGTKAGGMKIDSYQNGGTPGNSVVLDNWATIYLTSGPTGQLPGRVVADGKDSEWTLADILIHELGHVDGKWYHGGDDYDGMNSFGDAVRIENQTRQIEGLPMRIGHNEAGDVKLSGVPY